MYLYRPGLILSVQSENLVTSPYLPGSDMDYHYRKNSPCIIVYLKMQHHIGYIHANYVSQVAVTKILSHHTLQYTKHAYMYTYVCIVKNHKFFKRADFHVH